ncbi:MAG: hypothetical protein JW763_04670 [candidate division Zixibacteria bacterium]|nr:hypothetical protein [candidate division Zixibacteria bacterium]
MEIIFSTGRRQGKQSKRPRIETNEGELAKYVQIKSEVVANPDSTFPVRISPYKFDVSQFGDKEVAERKFVIENVSDQDLDIKLVDMPYGMFKLELPKKVKAGKSEGGKIVILDEWLKEEFEKSVTIELNDANNTRFTIPVKRTIRVPGQTASTKPESATGSH